MMIGRWTLGFMLVATLSACNAVETTRGGPIMVQPPRVVSSDAQNAPVTSAFAGEERNWRVADVRVIVPENLVVSEANVYLPAADIVWREDPEGDRKAQVARIIDTAVTQGVAHLQGPRAVYIDIELRQFHALSDKARATVGGTHAITFDMIVRDAATGEDLTEPERVQTELIAYGGFRALSAVRKGLSQKVRITHHVANLIRARFGAEQVPISETVALMNENRPHVAVPRVAVIGQTVTE